MTVYFTFLVGINKRKCLKEEYYEFSTDRR